MPHSADETTPGFVLAVTAEVLYISNLLILPGITFLVLLAIYFRHKNTAPDLAAAHITQTVTASIWAGILLILVNIMILLLGGYDGAWTWVILITYFTICHSVFVVLGILGLAKAMAGQCWRYPLIGPELPESCKQN